jgi:hypothetical protein
MLENIPTTTKEWAYRIYISPWKERLVKTMSHSPTKCSHWPCLPRISWDSQILRMLRKIFASHYPGDMYPPEDLNRYDITSQYVWREFRDKSIPRFPEHHWKLWIPILTLIPKILQSAPTRSEMRGKASPINWPAPPSVNDMNFCALHLMRIALQKLT